MNTIFTLFYAVGRVKIETSPFFCPLALAQPACECLKIMSTLQACCTYSIFITSTTTCFDMRALQLQLLSTQSQFRAVQTNWWLLFETDLLHDLLIVRKQLRKANKALWTKRPLALIHFSHNLSLRDRHTARLGAASLAII